MTFLPRDFVECWRREYKVVVLPDPVGPVNMIKPWENFNMANSSLSDFGNKDNC